jgi:hypothetical protein
VENKERATGRKRSSRRKWLSVALVTAGVGALVVAGGTAVALVRWSARSHRPPKSFARPGLTFDYPAAWAVDDRDKDYDPDHLFTIDASAGAMILFVIADADLDPAEALATNVQAQSKRVPSAVRTEFDRWGKYSGRGPCSAGR